MGFKTVSIPMGMLLHVAIAPNSGIIIQPPVTPGLGGLVWIIVPLGECCNGLSRLFFARQPFRQGTRQGVRVTGRNVIDLSIWLIESLRSAKYPGGSRPKMYQSNGGPRRCLPLIGKNAFEAFLDALLRVETNLIVNAFLECKVRHPQILPAKFQPSITDPVHIQLSLSPRFHLKKRAFSRQLIEFLRRIDHYIYSDLRLK